MRAVNLLPRDTNQKNVGLPRPTVLAGVCAGVLVVAVLGADFMVQSGKITSEQRKLDALQARVAKLPPAPPGPTSAQKDLAGQHNDRVRTLATAMSTRVAWDRVLRQFSLVLPDDVWLTQLTAVSPVSPSGTAATTTTAATSGSTTIPAPTQFTIDGHTYSHDSVARLLARLQVIPDLKNVTLVWSKEMQVANQNVIEFNISADIRTAGGGSQ